VQPPPNDDGGETPQDRGARPGEYSTGHRPDPDVLLRSPGR
jgi:hypothetical protein